MSGVIVSFEERRLARDGVKITFFKVLLKTSAIEAYYPGGLESFLDAYERISRKGNLLGLTFINLTEVNEFVQSMERAGMVKGRDIATANQIHGVLDRCTGIKFIHVERTLNPGALESFPVWYACLE